MRLCLLLLLCTTPALTQPNRRPVTLTWLANEGALLQAGTHAVVIDAFVTEPYTIYASLSPTTWQHMLDRKAPFHTIQYALVSHRHGDHFQADAAIAFLKHHPNTQLLASGDVSAELAGRNGYTDIQAQVLPTLPEPGQIQHFDKDGLRVDVLRIAHGGERWKDLHNLGHLIYMGGQTILHIGDASGDRKHFAPYKAQLSRIDIALIPFWFYTGSTRKKLDGLLHAKYEVAVHIPRKEVADVTRQIQARWPKVIIYGKEGEQHRFAPR